MPPIDYAKPGEEQTLQVTVKFLVLHNPGNDNHLREILRSYLKGKGVDMRDDGVVEV